jgi:hypothetical protein
MSTVSICHEAHTFGSVLKRFLPEPFVALMENCAQIEEPKRTGKLADLVASGPFEAVCSLVIVANVVHSFFAANHEMANGGRPMESGVYAEFLFVSFYCAELALRLAVHGWHFFCNKNMTWNIFDFILVCTATYNQTLGLWISGHETGMHNVNYMRSLRLLKMAKVLRVLRVMKCVAELRLILNSLLGSMLSLFWSIVTMSLIFYIFGLLFVQNAATYIGEQGNSLDAQTEDRIYDCFGSVQRSMLSLFKACTGGEDWSVHYDLLTPMGVQAGSLYLFFIAFSQIAFMNILTGLFVDSAMKLSEPDREHMVSESRRALAKQRRELQSILQEMDLDGNGMISAFEFQEQMRLENGKLPLYLETVGVHEADAERFFAMLKSASMGQEVEIGGFVDGCLKLRGDASSLDLQAVAFEVKSIHKEVHDLSADFQKIKAQKRHEWKV